MKYVDFYPLARFPIDNPTFGFSTKIYTKYHYIVIQADAPKEDPWALLLP